MKALEFEIQRQPTDFVCGPTCLHAVYQYFGREVSLETVIAEVHEIPGGGTLAVHLGSHALDRGFAATLYTHNLHVFDPTWFRPGIDLPAKLRAQAEVKQDLKLRLATEAYLRFLDKGGTIKQSGFTLDLLRSHIDRGIPLVAGLSATYLYESARETDDGQYDDVAGLPTGHFVVIRGYDGDQEHVLVADPYGDHPSGQHYSVHIERLLAALLLGVLTYDANLLVLEPSPAA
jgi:hypothetical protein